MSNKALTDIMKRNDIIIDKFEIEEVRILIKSYYVVYRLVEIILYQDNKNIFNKVFNKFEPEIINNDKVEKYIDWLFLEKVVKRINTKRPLFLLPDFYQPESVKKYGMITILIMEFQLELLNKVYDTLGNRKNVTKKVYTIHSDKKITFSRFNNFSVQDFNFDNYVNNKMKIVFDKKKTIIDNVIFNIIKDKFLLKQFCNRFLFLSVFGEDFIIYDQEKFIPIYDLLTDKVEDFIKKGIDYRYLPFFKEKNIDFSFEHFSYKNIETITYIEVNKCRKTKKMINEVLIYSIKQLIGRVLIISDSFYENIVNFKDDMFYDTNDSFLDEGFDDEDEF